MNEPFSGDHERFRGGPRVVPHARCLGRRSRRLAELGFVAVVLSACVGYTPDPLVPREALQQLRQRAMLDLHLPAAALWREEWLPLESEIRIADGLTIGEANAIALFSSPRIRAARAGARVTGAQVLQAGVLANPELFLGPRISTQDSDLIFPASLSWELPLWGKPDAERELAGARLTESRLRVIEIELDTLRRVREHFLHLHRLQREETILATLSASSRQVVAWVERLRESNEVDAAAVYLARAELADASAALEGTRAEALRSRRSLLALLGFLPDAPVEFAVDAAAVLPQLAEPDAEALLALPVLRAAEAAYASAEAALRAEITKQYPGIRFGPEFEADRGDPTIGLGLGITLPLFDRNQGGIAAALESRQRARESYSAVLLEASHAEASARDELASAQRLLEIHLAGAMQDADAASRAIETRLRTGRAQVLEMLAAQRAIARAHARRLELEEQVAAARLRSAVAGGLALQRPGSEAKEQEQP